MPEEITVEKVMDLKGLPSPMPVSVTMPTIIPAAAHATETIMAFFAPFSRARINNLNSLRPNLPRLIRWESPLGSRVVSTAHRTVFAIKLVASVLITATNPAIMGE